ncbi:MAG: EAL domain-containing protein [Nitrococcus sp.]|nr:EAL domain-containing protein [Nitrococcus sp.]
MSHTSQSRQPAVAEAEGAQGQSRRTNHAGEVRADQIKLLYDQLPSALVAIAVNSAITAFVLWEQSPHPALIAWLAFVGALTFARYVLGLAYARAGPARDAAPYWGRCFLIGVGLSGISWGILGSLLFPQQSLLYQAFIGLVLAGMSAASLGTLSSYPGAALAFLLPAILPYSVRLLIQNDPLHIAMGAMALLFLGMMYLVLGRLHVSITSSLRLRYENLDLLGDLSRARIEQEAVNQRLHAEIVQRREVQTNLQEREALVHAIINSLAAGIVVLNAAGRIISVNQAWQTHAAASDDPLLRDVTLGTDYLAHCAAAAGRDPVARRLAAAIQTLLRDDIPETTLEYRRDGAESQWYLVSVTQFKSSHGVAVISHLNITQRKQAEERLLLAAVFENTNEAIFILDKGLKILAVNKAFTEITAYRADEVVGKRPNRFHPYRFDPDIYRHLRSAIRRAGQWQGEAMGRRRDGNTYPVWVSFKTVRDQQGNITHFVIVFSDNTLRKKTERHLYELAYRDALTKLPNRAVLRKHVKHAFAQADRHGWQVAVMFLDLDRFKFINDTLGHEAGDQLLVEVARRLVHCVGAEDTVARLGGDEFTVVLEHTAHSREIARVVKKIMRTLAQPVTIGGHEIHTSASIGIAVYPRDGENESVILKNADAAMYRAKEQGRDRYHFYTSEMNALALDRMWLEGNLRGSIQRQELQLRYQPIVKINTGKMYKFEALARWRHPQRGWIPPSEFIPVAEDIGFIVPLSRWVLQQTLQHMHVLAKHKLPALVGAVNISARQFRRQGIMPGLDQFLRQARSASGHIIEIELTESSLMQDTESATANLQGLRERGIRIALDDFGTGYSSLRLLKELPIDVVKIDQSFIANLTTNLDDAAIVQAIIAMAHSLKLDVVAEGVETLEQATLLERWGCDAAQGYFFSPPLASGDFIELYQQQISRH